MRRHRFCASMPSLKTIATVPCRFMAPRVSLVRLRMVENADSMGLIVRIDTQCCRVVEEGEQLGQVIEQALGRLGVAVAEKLDELPDPGHGTVAARGVPDVAQGFARGLFGARAHVAVDVALLVDPAPLQARLGEHPVQRFPQAAGAVGDHQTRRVHPAQVQAAQHPLPSFGALARGLLDRQQALLAPGGDAHRYQQAHLVLAPAHRHVDAVHPQIDPLVVPQDPS